MALGTLLIRNTLKFRSHGLSMIPPDSFPILKGTSECAAIGLNLDSPSFTTKRECLFVTMNIPNAVKMSWQEL
jgi:hypothetical protein